jgi:phosphoribosylformimino-5-aminoimidazole carboxamide ribotide isomerase
MMQIIPAIDIINGKCVRLVQGDFLQQKTYNENPLEVAKQFEAAGLQRLHLVDLDGAKSGAISNFSVLQAICSKTKLQVDFGGGIKTKAAAQSVLDAGAGWITVGSMAVKDEKEVLLWKEQFGAGKIILGADVKEECITINGWQQPTEINIIDFIHGYFSKGFTQIFCTDIHKDGKLEGPSIALYKKIKTAFPHLFFIASGGVSCMEDLHLLKSIGCNGAIIGKAIYENKITLDQLQSFNAC